MLLLIECSAQCFFFFSGVMKAFSTVSACAVTTTGCNFAGRTSKQRLSLIPGLHYFHLHMYLDTGNFLLKSASSFLIQQKISFYSLISFTFFVCVKLYFHGILYCCLSKLPNVNKTNELIKNYEKYCFSNESMKWHN
jgi:hypothetical protein